MSERPRRGWEGDPGEGRRRPLDRHGPPLEPSSFSLYDTRVVSEEQIQGWADEAEAGYDVDVLKRRGRGRPGRGAEPMQVVAVRLTAEELDALDAAAAKNDMSRSEAIRAALAHFAA
jgi:Ribbon-helix-helix protein, copG family